MKGRCFGLSTSKDGPVTIFFHELHGEINTVYATVCIFYNRHLEVLFARPPSMDNIRKSKGIFPVDVQLKYKDQALNYSFKK